MAKLPRCTEIRRCLEMYGVENYYMLPPFNIPQCYGILQRLSWIGKRQLWQVLDVQKSEAIWRRAW